MSRSYRTITCNRHRPGRPPSNRHGQEVTADAVKNNCEGEALEEWCCESFDERLRDDFLNGEVLYSLKET